MYENILPKRYERPDIELSNHWSTAKFLHFDVLLIRKNRRFLWMTSCIIIAIAMVLTYVKVLYPPTRGLFDLAYAMCLLAVLWLGHFFRYEYIHYSGRIEAMQISKRQMELIKQLEVMEAHAV